jgi:hypothetical protein
MGIRKKIEKEIRGRENIECGEKMGVDDSVRVGYVKIFYVG